MQHSNSSQQQDNIAAAAGAGRGVGGGNYFKTTTSLASSASSSSKKREREELEEASLEESSSPDKKFMGRGGGSSSSSNGSGSNSNSNNSKGIRRRRPSSGILSPSKAFKARLMFLSPAKDRLLKLSPSKERLLLKLSPSKERMLKLSPTKERFLKQSSSPSLAKERLALKLSPTKDRLFMLSPSMQQLKISPSKQNHHILKSPLGKSGHYHNHNHNHHPSITSSPLSRKAFGTNGSSGGRGNSPNSQIFSAASSASRGMLDFSSPFKGASPSFKQSRANSRNDAMPSPSKLATVQPRRKSSIQQPGDSFYGLFPALSSLNTKAAPAAEASHISHIPDDPFISPPKQIEKDLNSDIWNDELMSDLGFTNDNKNSPFSNVLDNSTSFNAGGSNGGFSLDNNYDSSSFVDNRNGSHFLGGNLTSELDLDQFFGGVGSGLNSNFNAHDTFNDGGSMPFNLPSSSLDPYPATTRKLLPVENNDPRFDQLQSETVISRAELDDLFIEISKDSAYSNVIKNSAGTSSTVGPSISKKKGKDFTPINWLLNESCAFSIEQVSTLRSQIEDTFQLCAQEFAFERELSGVGAGVQINTAVSAPTYFIPNLQTNTAAGVSSTNFWEDQLIQFAKLKEIGVQVVGGASVFNIDGLEKAITLHNFLATTPNESFCKMYGKSKNGGIKGSIPTPPSLANVFKMFGSIFSDSLRPVLVPSKRVRGGLLDPEEALLFQGITRFGEFDVPSIQAHCLPGKSYSQIYNRIRYMTKRATSSRAYSRSQASMLIRQYHLLPFKPMNSYEKYILTQGLLKYGMNFKNVLTLVFPHVPGPLVELAWNELRQIGDIAFDYPVRIKIKEPSPLVKSAAMKKIVPKIYDKGEDSGVNYTLALPRKAVNASAPKSTLLFPQGVSIPCEIDNLVGNAHIPNQFLSSVSNALMAAKEDGLDSTNDIYQTDLENNFSNVHGGGMMAGMESQSSPSGFLSSLINHDSGGRGGGVGKGRTGTRKKRTRIDKDVIDTSESKAKIRRKMTVETDIDIPYNIDSPLVPAKKRKQKAKPVKVTGTLN